jgi:hypothetical protein
MEPIEGSKVMKPDDLSYSLSPRFGGRVGVRGQDTSRQFSNRTVLGKRALP